MHTGTTASCGRWALGKNAQFPHSKGVRGRPDRANAGSDMKSPSEISKRCKTCTANSHRAHLKGCDRSASKSGKRRNYPKERAAAGGGARAKKKLRKKGSLQSMFSTQSSATTANATTPMSSRSEYATRTLLPKACAVRLHIRIPA